MSDATVGLVFLAIFVGISYVVWDKVEEEYKKEKEDREKYKDLFERLVSSVEIISDKRVKEESQ
jgi:membrane protein implicated in regulation of membrane protease activity